MVFEKRPDDERVVDDTDVGLVVPALVPGKEFRGPRRGGRVDVEPDSKCAAC
jgi:hypothetical protein